MQEALSHVLRQPTLISQALTRVWVVMRVLQRQTRTRRGFCWESQRYQGAEAQIQAGSSTVFRRRQRQILEGLELSLFRVRSYILD